MAHQGQHIFCYQSFHINKSQPLGQGSYGAVYKAKCDQLPCAAKILHPTILADLENPGAGKIMERFQQECAFLNSIRHPNIVQYLGMTRDPETRLPVLLMELLDESLTKMLKRSQQPLAYCVEVDICHDIALAVAYLHSNDILHRDLSSNNVLMITGRRAKVTDFGMSKLADAAPTKTSLTVCPGTLVYMPPEALREPPTHTKKLDCFSEGVLMIQVCSRQWPEPGPRTWIIQAPGSPTGIAEAHVLETDRRKNHIDLIDHNHPLLPIATDCLQFQENDRPSSEELCQKLAGLKESMEYRESMHCHNNDIQSKDNQIMVLAQQLQDKDRQLQQLEIQVRQYREEIASREGQLGLNQQVIEQEQVISEIQQTNLSLQLNQHSLTPPQPPPSSQHQSSLRTKEREFILNWRCGDKAPICMSRGATAVDGNVAYFMNWSGEIYCYNSLSDGSWTELPKCPYQYSGLVIINSQLTTVGGIIGSECTNELLSLQLSDFKVIFPPMPTNRCSTTAIITKKHLVVAGGETGGPLGGAIDQVEVMDTKTLVWSTVANLPYPYRYASGTVCGDRLYVLGGTIKDRMNKSVLTCSLTELLQSSSSSSISVWHRVPDAPYCHSTGAIVNGELLVFGGRYDITKIYKYNLANSSWDRVGKMPTGRSRSLIAVFPTNELMVVGGNIKPNQSFTDQDVNYVDFAKF